MTLNQLAVLKQWHVAHRQRPLELHAWDTMLTLWVLGWMGLVVALLLAQPVMAAASALSIAAPGAYVRLRRRLHRRGRLRCDWMGASQSER